MTYNVPFTDQANKGTITVEGTSPNTDTSLQLPPQNSTDYGLPILTNFLHLLENFADVNPPLNPVEGQLWYDTTNDVDQLKIYDGTNWVAAGGLKKSGAEPESINSTVGDLWVDTSTSQLYLYTGSGWILVGPSFATGNKTGSLAEQIVDNSDITRDVLINYVNNIPVSIISAVAFLPKATLSGFENGIQVGTTQSTNVSANPALIKGISQQASYLQETPSFTDRPNGTVTVSDLAKKNDTNIFTQLQKFPNGGIEIGTVKTFSALVESTSGILELAGAGTIDVRTPVSTNPVVRISNDGNFGINTLSPTEKLDMRGNVVIGVETGDDAALDTSGKLTVNSEFDSIAPTSGAAVIKGGLGVAKQLQVGGRATFTDVIQTNPTGTVIEPDTNGQGIIGSTSKRYSGIYANTVYGNLQGNVNGNVTGNVTGSSSKLTSPTNFSMTGDVSANSFTFDGQTGGSTKTFTTTINDDFINTKLDVAAQLGRLISTDEIIIYRPTADDVTVDPTGTLGVFKTTVADITAKISQLPIGTVMMWAGLTAPPGWFICDGSDYLIADYENLANALGWDRFNSTTWYWGTPFSGSGEYYFRIPDFTGRMPVGSSVANSGALQSWQSTTHRIGNTATQSMGGITGDDEVTLVSDNLPDHTHDLLSSTGEQFYAVTNASTSAPETLSGGGIDGGTGSRLSNSGTITDGTGNSPVDITPPFAAINFIIYHGVT
tara:strand:- start:9518 stop:11671 length:2154 start_codon:yes stop_codon:yes gene_type:complete